MTKVFVVFGFLTGCVYLCECSNSTYRFYQREKTYDILQEPQSSRGHAKFPRKYLLCLAVGLCASNLPRPGHTAAPKLKLVQQWKQLEFDYPTPADRQNDIDSGAFTPNLIAPIDVDVYYSPSRTNNQIFVTIPKFIEGVPVTLGTVSNKNLDGNPLVEPYPSWSWHKNTEACPRDRLVSVFRVKIDECGRLWVLDTGKVGSNVICPPQIVAFDLTTNQVIHRHEFPKEILPAQYLLVTPEIDVRDPTSGCRDTFVYAADVLGYSLFVHDVANNRSWRIQDKTFYPYPNYGTYNIAGESFELMDGILGLALSPYKPGQDRVLFYHAMSSGAENWVYTSHLRNQTLFQDDPSAAPRIFHTYSRTRDTQTAAEAIDKDGIMFFGLITELQIACWNTRADYGPKKFDVVASDPITLQFPSGVKIIRNKKGEQELWIMTSRFQKISNGSLDPKETNFRIQAGKVDDLVYGTQCKSKFPHENQVGGSSGGQYGLYTVKT